MNVIRYKLPKVNDRMLIAIQFWNGDAQDAYSLARLLADIEPEHQKRADLLLISRFDTPIDPQVVKEVSRKFDVHQHRCKRRGTGYPAGCNDLWFGVWEWIAGRQARGVAYKMAFTCEGDGAPVAQDWISRLHQSWDKSQPAYVVGAYLGDHINGNGLFSCHPAFVAYLTRRVVMVTRDAGWDRVLWPNFQQWGAKGIEEIRSYWQTPTMNPEWFEAEAASGAVWVHGVKDRSLHQRARKRLIST